MDFDPETGERLDYYQFSSKLETIRERFQNRLQGALDERVGADGEKVAIKVTAVLEQDIRQDLESDESITVHITGFAKIIGELIDGLFEVMLFFGIAVLIATILLFWYTRCIRSTLVVIFVTAGCGGLADWVFLHLLGFELDPFSILVPFLIFAIGVSHGAQKLNGVLQDIGRGSHPLCGLTLYLQAAVSRRRYRTAV